MTTTTQSSPPWLRRKDWSAGITRDNTVARTFIIWIFTLLWNLATIPMCLDELKEIHRNKFTHLPFAAIFLVVGLATLIWAIRSALAAAKFGRSTLHLQTLPASPGGTLAGTIQVTRTIDPHSPLQLRLVCVHRTRSTANQRHDDGYFEVDDWQSTQTLDRLGVSTPL